MRNIIEVTSKYKFL